MNGYAIFINDDDSETKLSWNELQVKENGQKYGYMAGCIYNEKIADEAFNNCKKLKEIYIPTTVEYIYPFAFYECPNLEKVIASKGLAIYDEVFNGTKVERTDEKFCDYEECLEELREYTKYFLEIELNNIQEIPNIFNRINLNTGHYDDDSEDSEVILDMLNLRDSKGERCFNVFEIDKCYDNRIHVEKCRKNLYSMYDEIGLIDYHKINEEFKQTIKYSEKLGIKPNLYSSPEVLEYYIKELEKIEDVQAKENE